MSFITGTWAECLYASTAVGIERNTFTSEVILNDTASMGVQCHLPPDFFLPQKNQVGRGVRVVARGIFSTTGQPTFTLTVRAGSAGSTASAILLGTAAMGTVNNAVNELFELQGDVVLTGIGAAGTNSTVQGIGMVASPGLTVPLAKAYGGAASPGTVATFDTSVVNYINVNAACSVSSASNKIQLQQLLVFGLN